MGVKKHKYYLKGLDCANCANSYEKELNKLDYIDDATVDFTNQTLFVNYDDKNYDKLAKFSEHFEDKIYLSEDNDEEEEEGDFSKTKLILIIVAVLLTVLTFFVHFDQPIKIGILVVAYLLAGYDILIKLVKNLVKGKVFDENFLMGVATIAAFGIGEYKEAIMVMVFYKVGEFFQDLAVNRSRKSITALVDIQANTANLVEGDTIKVVDPKDVKIGDIILVKPGEKIPLDGSIVEGSTYLDTKALTGESVAVAVKEGDEVLSGSINNESVIKVKVDKPYEDSTVSKILDLVENASASKAPTEKFITKFASIYTPIVVMIAILVALVPPLTFAHADGFYPWIYKAIIFLVVSCPCALVLSIPLTYFGGVGNASRHGILVKGANYLDILSNVDTFVFDKTGTLTKGNFTVVDIIPNNVSKEELLEIAAEVESLSNHPIAKAIINDYGKEVDSSIISNYQEISGQGIKANIGKDVILAGNDKLMNENKIKFDVQDTPNTLIYLAKNNEYIGCIMIADEIKPDTKEGLDQLKALGIKDLIMLSGDNDGIVTSIAQKLGLTKWYGKLLPQDKVSKLEEILKQEQGKGKVAYVGDGINDAPVLVRSDVGIAMGGVGSDAAIESADVVIMNDEISKLATAIKISYKTKKIVKQNIALALGVKLIVVILGLLGMAQIWEAIIADVGVALLAILNTLRILNDKGVDDGNMGSDDCGSKSSNTTDDAEYLTYL